MSAANQPLRGVPPRGERRNWRSGMPSPNWALTYPLTDFDNAASEAVEHRERIMNQIDAGAVSRETLP